MSSQHPIPVDEATLHAYVDGQLTAEDAAEVARRLQQQPEAAERVLAWQAQRHQLQALRLEMLDEPLPERWAALWHAAASSGRSAPDPAARVDDTARPAASEPQPAAAISPRAPRRAANGPWLAVATLLVGLGLGWLARPLLPAPGAASVQAAADTPPPFVQDAAVAHAVYVPEKRHPVEVGADQETHLVQWLSRRLGTPLHVPVLNDQGFHLVGGRLLPGRVAAPAPASARPASSQPAPVDARAQFMYESTAGERLTLYITVLPQAESAASQAGTAFRFTRSGEGAAQRHSFYWIDGPLGYALTGAADRERLAALAASVYRQLSPPAGVPRAP